MSCIDHVAIYSPFWVIVLVSSCCQALQLNASNTTVDDSYTITENYTSETTIPTSSEAVTTDSPYPVLENLTADTINSSSIELKWDCIGDLDGFNISWRKVLNDSKLHHVLEVNNTAKIIDGLDAWTEYIFTVTAFFKRPTQSLSLNVTAKTEPSVPSQPKEVSVVVNSSTIFIQWEEPSNPNGPLDGYRILLLDQEDITLETKNLSRNVTSEYFEGLTPWTNYSIVICAFNLWKGNELQNNVFVSVLTNFSAPSVPKNFNATANSSKTIVLSWEAPESANGPLDGFILSYGRNDDEIQNSLVNVSGDVTNFTVERLEPWTNYTFSIVAFNGNLTSKEAKSYERTAPHAPSPPRDLKAFAYGSYAVILNWDKPQIPSGPVDGYEVCWRAHMITSCSNTTGNSVNITGLRSATKYTISVAAYNVWRNQIFSSKKIIIHIETNNPVIEEPIQLKAVSYNLTTIHVTWKPPLIYDHNITVYNISWILENECESDITSESHSWINVNSTEYWLFDMQPATTYSIYVCAYIEKNDEYVMISHNCTDIRTEDDLPVKPVNLTCLNANSTSIEISWMEPPLFKGFITNYTLKYKKISDFYSKSEEVNTEEKYLVVTNLEFYTQYQFNVSAWTSKGQGEFSKPLFCRTSSAVPSKINRITISPSNATCMKSEWSPPEPFPGPTNYSLTIYEMDSCGKRPDIEKGILENIGYENDTAEFCNLRPYSAYYVTIVSTTKAGNSTSNSSPGRTFSGRPEPVKNVKYNCNYNTDRMHILWNIPERPNGKVKGFSILYVGKKGSRNHSGDITVPYTKEKECDEKSINATVDKLFPEFSYYFTISMFIKNDEGNITNGDEYKFKCTLPAGVPPYPEKNITVVNRSKRQITFLLKKDTFSDQMGDIIEYAVVVAEAGHIGTKQNGKRGIRKLPTWADFETNSTVNVYQATPDKWNPFNEVPNDPLKCMAVEDGKECVLGYETRCSQEERAYCNGPLRPGSRYGIKIRGFTKSGFAETPPVITYTAPEAQKGDSGLIIAIVVSFLFLMLIATGALIYKKFGIIRFFGKTVMENSTETNDIAFMSIIAKSRPIKLSGFAGHVSAMMADSQLKFSQEFEELKSISPIHTSSVAQMQENKSKNRWINILPFDHSRVKLLPMDDEPGSDYINASYIPGYNSHREYIATQGPLPNTTDDMWRMIWEHGISMVVMLTQCVERGKTKCEQYWPSDKEERAYGDLKVQTIHESVLTDYTIRSFDVSLGERHRIITQMHFTQWPDFGCPDNTELLINFVRTVRDRLIENDPNPILVHCSAGVGRTGTFIAVNRLAQHIESGLHDFVDVFYTVLDMRQHRTNMVQTEDQYIYIHECVRDLIQEKLARKNESYKNDEIYGNLGDHTATNM